jgi:glycerol-3-phosphate cytidylyltransferase
VSNDILGVMAGGFNLLHVGHIEALTEASENCTKLTVILVRDQSSKGHKLLQEDIEDRYLKLKALKCVDEIIPCESEQNLLELLKLLRYNFFFLSEEYKNGGFEEGKKIVGENRLFYVPRKHNWSTTNEVAKITK